MNRNNVGVSFTHNEPSTLTREEKALRAKVRAAQRELEFQRGRVRRFEAELEASTNPVRRAAAGAELDLAREAVGKWEVTLTELQTGAVN